MKMKRSIFTLLCWAFVPILTANIISWYSDNTDAISKKCYEENQLPTALRKQLERDQLVDDPKIHAVVLCQAKAINVYSEERGLDTLLLTKTYFRGTKYSERKKYLVDGCVDDNKSIVSPGKNLYKVLECLYKMDAQTAYISI